MPRFELGEYFIDIMKIASIIIQHVAVFYFENLRFL